MIVREKRERPSKALFMSSLDEITKIRTDDRTRTRGIYIFIKALIAIAVFLNVVENLSPCNKVTENSFFLQTDTHTHNPTLIFVQVTTLFAILSPRFPDSPSTSSSHELSPKPVPLEPRERS